MKRILSLLLSIVMLVSITSGLNLSAYAATTAITGGSSMSSAKSITYSTEYGVILDSAGAQWFKFTTLNSDAYWYNITIKNVSVGNNNGFYGISGTIYDGFNEQFCYAGAHSGDVSSDGGKLEPNTTYYIAVWGCRAGTIKFQLDYVFDKYDETNDASSSIEFGTIYNSTIDSPAGLADNRNGDRLSGDVDFVNFNTSNITKIKFTLTNIDVSYYNTYFEGIVGIIIDDFGEQYAYVEVRPNSEEYVEVELEKNTNYYVKFLSTSGGTGKYKFIIECIHNWNSGTVTKKSTCTTTGIKTHVCLQCGDNYTESIEKKAHNYKTTTTKATLTKSGSKVTKCIVCGYQKSKSTIYKISSIKLSGTTFTYNGNVRSPYPIIKDSKGNKLVKGTDYTVTYGSTSRKYVGKHKVTIKFKGNYSGTKTLYFTIKPKATPINSLTAGDNRFTVKWKKQSTQCTGYQIQYSTSSKFTSSTTKTSTVSSYKTTSKTIKSLKNKKKYYVRIRTYKTVNGTKYYSSWSSVKSVTTK